MEQVPNTYNELFIAYGALWIIICGYLWHLSRKVDALTRRQS
jgi:CcmD family protein